LPSDLGVFTHLQQIDCVFAEGEYSLEFGGKRASTG
jgi:hypothetical protein